MAKTALELTPEEWKAYNPLGDKKQRAKRYDAKRRQKAMRVARRAAKLLREQFSASKVVAFGSLAHRAWFTARSDIDLMAWGIPPDQYFKAVAVITGLSPDFKIDLVDPDLCSPNLLHAVERDHIEL